MVCKRSQIGCVQGEHGMKMECEMEPIVSTIATVGEMLTLTLNKSITSKDRHHILANNYVYR